MKNQLVRKQLTLAILMAASPAFAANFGAPATAAKAASASVATGSSNVITNTNTTPTGKPQVADTFRVANADGSAVIQQGTMGSDTSALAVLTVSENDAIAKGEGRCAFNVRYDEISQSAAKGTTNRIYSNDKLVAQNTMIDLLPGTLRTVSTIAYLFAGQNTLRVVANADSATPSTKGIRVSVSGNCGGTTVPVTTPPSTSPPPTTTPPTTKPPTTEPPTTKPPVTSPPTTPPPSTSPPTTTPPTTASFKPGSAEWNNLTNVYGYSNFAVTQLKGKGYSRYQDLVKFNTILTEYINAKTVTQGAYNSLMAGWNSFVNDPEFKNLITKATPGTGK